MMSEAVAALRIAQHCLPGTARLVVTYEVDDVVLHMHVLIGVKCVLAI